ncbi:peptidylprolyl isomerase [candidate division WOR-3 bacterium]|jgi:peptidyl-prolyl cis-trans isomerase C|nr:peptidylprolyl isomerase [candidate division WOR-3 bacterium]
MKSKILLVAILIITLVIAGCKGGNAKKNKENALCVVNGEPFTMEEYNEFIAQYQEQSQGPVTPEIKNQIVSQWISNEILYQEAKKNKVDCDNDVKRKVEILKKQIIATEYLNKVLKEKAQVTDNDILDFYNMHKKEYEVSIKISRIMTFSLDKAQEALEEINKGRSFLSVARKYSVDYNPQQGITIGPFQRGGALAQLPEIEDAAFALKSIGSVSSVVSTKYGFFVVKLVSRKKIQKPISLDSAKNTIYIKLSLNKQTNIYNTLLDSLKRNSKITLSVTP